jgi:anthranilate synthase component 2
MKKKVFVLDNYDSFTYNLVHFLDKAGADETDIVVKRNDEFDIHELKAFDKILISPGPGIPQEAGLTMKTLQIYHSTKSILGVCLGHQAIGLAFGSTLKNLSEPLHGVQTNLKMVSKDYLFQNCPNDFKVGHYHSWVLEKPANDLEILALNDNGLIMSVRHKRYDIRGIQFHPESILTEYGFEIIRNWLVH